MPDPHDRLDEAQQPDPRTARDDDEDATNQGVSTSDPAEGPDTGGTAGSPGN